MTRLHATLETTPATFGVDAENREVREIAIDAGDYAAATGLLAEQVPAGYRVIAVRTSTKP